MRSVPEDFPTRLAAASRRVLMLDYDGTLAPFRPERDEAVPYPGVRDRLRRIFPDPRTRLVVISGRGVADLLPLLGLDPVPEIWGSHGWERRRPGGEAEMMALPEAAALALAEARSLAEEQGFAPQCEGKPVGLAVHWRGLPPSEARTLRAQVQRCWGPFTHSGHLGGHLELHEFDGGLELRVPGWDKGRAVRAILADEPDDALAVYLGDDRTDEDAFAELAGRGLGVLVRQEPRLTLAQSWIRPPEALLQFLDTWIQCANLGP